jgi:hypothetical protein
MGASLKLSVPANIRNDPSASREGAPFPRTREAVPNRVKGVLSEIFPNAREVSARLKAGGGHVPDFNQYLTPLAQLLGGALAWPNT